VDVRSSNLDNVLRSADLLFQSLRQRYGFSNVQSDPPNFELPGPELVITVDRVRAANMGIDAATVGAAVQKAHQKRSREVSRRNVKREG
jgi:multidrug efflux pump subunit AcrB